MLYSYKKKFQDFAEKLAHKNLTANHATILGFVFVALTSAGFTLGLSTSNPSVWLLFTPIFILFRMIMNALDGLLARAQNTASVWGEILNEISDVLGDTLSYGGIYWITNREHQAIIVFLILIWLCEFIAVLGKSLPGGRRRQESLGGGKPERAVAMGLLAIILYFYPPFTAYLNVFFIVISFLILMTTIKRIRASLRDAKGKTYQSVTQFGR